MSEMVDSERALQLYAEDKKLGRRMANGAKPLKKLSARHRQLISLCLQGYSNNEIAVILDYTVSRVSLIRNDPLVQQALESFLSDADQQLAQLLPKAVNAISRGLDSGDLNHALSAADKVFKTQGKFKENAERKQAVTAEDVARQIIQVKGEATITLEQGKRVSIEDTKTQ